jgi:hypothetical protein
MKDLIKTGYWWSEREPHLPMPVENKGVVTDFEVLHYLTQGEVLHRWRGFSPCRLCDKRSNGTTCLSDGTYQWPVGLAHYVEKHGVILDADFIAHIKRDHVQPSGEVTVRSVYFDPEDGTWDK